ncbi:MAG: 3D domain-containing protein [Thermacetogeniaceae bacterium]
MKPILRKFTSLVSARLVLASSLAGLLIWGVLAMAPQPLIIKVDGQPVVHKSLHRTVEAVLAEAGVKLGPKDAVQPDPGATVARGMVITVNRAVSVRVNVDGRSMVVQTPKVPVRDVLQAARVNLGSLDRVSLPPAQVVADGTVITVNRIAEQVVTENYQLPVPVERMDDSQMERGESRVVRAGTPGQAQRLIRVTYVDGRPASRVLLKDQVVRTPVSKLLAFGTVSIVSRGGNTIRFRKAIDAVATAYSFNNGRYTCTGRLVKFGSVAVDPNVIPLGSRLYVEGYGYATAADIGSAIRGNRIDVFFESERDCERWGLRSTKVYVLN